jgi:hypothetical protein
MKNPHRRRTVSLVTVGIGLLLCAVPFLLPANLRTPWLLPALFGTGLVSVTFGGLITVWSLNQVRVRASLLENKGRLGRWRVDPHTWRQFVELDRTFSVNEIPADLAVPSDGIEVLVGESGMMIGDYVYTFCHRSNINGVVRYARGDWRILKVGLGGDAPCCFYLYASMEGQDTADAYSNLVFPVPTSAIPEAKKVLNHFQATVESSK